MIVLTRQGLNITTRRVSVTFMTRRAAMEAARTPVGKGNVLMGPVLVEWD